MLGGGLEKYRMVLQLAEWLGFVGLVSCLAPSKGFLGLNIVRPFRREEESGIASR